jgi:uncharacterized membrane protein YgdD (TMEM256/DUF423 family)
MNGRKEVLAFLVDHLTSTVAVAVGAYGGMGTKDKVKDEKRDQCFISLDIQ